MVDEVVPFLFLPFRAKLTKFGEGQKYLSSSQRTPYPPQDKGVAI